MKLLLRVALCLALSLVGGRSEAQDIAGPTLPEGHPLLPAQMASGQAQREEESSGADEEATTEHELPPGHPAIATGAPAKDADSIKGDTGLPVGTVVVEAVDAQGRGVSGLDVELEVVRESVAQGKSRTSRVAPTGADGSARFEALPSDTAHSFRARIGHDGATFASAAFVLERRNGTHVRLHVYPVTHDIDAARVASLARVYVLPQEEAFLVEAMFSIANFGAVAWVPSNVTIELPGGAEAFTAREGVDTLAVVPQDRRDVARLEGTVAPGVSSVVFSVRVPRSDVSNEQLKLGVPPHLIQAEVMAESAPRMTLAVRGFPAATAERNDDGRRVLVTGARIAGTAKSLLNVLDITVGGLPVRGPGRWVALVLAVGLAVGGVVAHKRVGNTRPMRGLPTEDVQAARSLILGELGALERARQEGRVGPRTYEQARRELVDALARLELEAG